MTPEEAIKYIIQHCNPDYPKGKTEWETAINMAISALEKQIPRKAIGDHYAHMRCPTCKHRIPSGQGSSSRRRDNWCNYCGQAIDWTEDET